MEKFEVVCSECETEYTVSSEEGTQPEYCAYCGEYNFDDTEGQNEDDEEDDES